MAIPPRISLHLKRRFYLIILCLLLEWTIFRRIDFTVNFRREWLAIFFYLSLILATIVFAIINLKITWGAMKVSRSKKLQMLTSSSNPKPVSMSTIYSYDLTRWKELLLIFVCDAFVCYQLRNMFHIFSPTCIEIFLPWIDFWNTYLFHLYVLGRKIQRDSMWEDLCKVQAKADRKKRPQRKSITSTG